MFAEATPLLRMQGIDKAFPGVQALRQAHLELRAGEVLALLGENGAGKSTLIKVLSGAHQPDAGHIFIDGREVRIRSPIVAQALGIAVIYQEFNLVPTLSARENIFLGQETTRAGFVDRRQEYRKAMALFDRLSVRIDPDMLCKRMTVAQQQVVEIARALATRARIIVMDEPSATLTLQETRKLFEIIRELKANGLGIIYISHRLDEIFDIADRVTVMRDGECIETCEIGQTSRERLIELMVGRKLENEFPAKSAKIGEERLVVKNLRRGRAVRGVSFSVRAGEVLGIAGLVGAGKTELARLLFGADPADGGEIFLDGRPVRFAHPREAIRAGVCLLPEDRQTQGLIQGLSVRENFGLPNLNRWSRGGFIQRNREAAALQRYVQDLSIKIADPEQPVRHLSGGNQQKVVLAKWLEAHSRVIIFDEPTRGIDVGAKYEIYLLINRLAEQGKAIVLISSELPEVIGMSDRILVMHEGRISAEFSDVSAVTQERIMRHAVGERDTQPHD